MSFELIQQLQQKITGIKDVLGKLTNNPTQIKTEKTATQPSQSQSALKTLSPTNLPIPKNQAFSMKLPTPEDKQLPKTTEEKAKEFIGSQIRQTKESTPFIPEAAKEIVTKPKETAKLLSDFNVGVLTTIGKTAVNVLNIMNSLSPTLGSDYLKEQKTKAGEKFAAAKEYLTPLSPASTSEKIALFGGKMTGEVIKYVVLNKMFASLLSTHHIIPNYEKLSQYGVTDLSQKADMVGEEVIAKNIRSLDLTGVKSFDDFIKLVKPIIGNNQELNRHLIESIGATISKTVTDYFSDPSIIQSALKTGVAINAPEITRSGKFLADMATFIGMGQIDYEKGQESRLERALLDSAALLAFEGAGATLQGISKAGLKTLESLKIGNKIKLLEIEDLLNEIKSNQLKDYK